MAHADEGIDQWQEESPAAEAARSEAVYHHHRGAWESNILNELNFVNFERLVPVVNAVTRVQDFSRKDLRLNPGNLA